MFLFYLSYIKIKNKITLNMFCPVEMFIILPLLSSEHIGGTHKPQPLKLVEYNIFWNMFSKTINFMTGFSVVLQYVSQKLCEVKRFLSRMYILSETFLS
jgi:hypothetical protein